jgi:hypothetical protein
LVKAGLDTERLGMRSKLRYLATLVAVGAGLVLAPGASANDTNCIGALTGFHDNVVVPGGATCTILNAQIQGNVKALPGSVLNMSGGTTVGGSVEGDKPNNVQIFGAGNVVRGDIQVKEGGNGVQGVSVCGVTMPDGNIQIEKMFGGIFVGGSGCAAFGGGNRLFKGGIKVEENFVTATFGMTIGQNRVDQLQVFKNNGPGAKTVAGNTVRQNLQCKKNRGPFVGGPNTARHRQGQCF